MVSDGGGGGGDGVDAASAGYFVDQNQQQAMALPGMMGSLTATSEAAAASEDPSKKIRKPYTITKSRESWTEQEHDKFLEALQLRIVGLGIVEKVIGEKHILDSVEVGDFMKENDMIFSSTVQGLLHLGTKMTC